MSLPHLLYRAVAVLHGHDFCFWDDESPTSYADLRRSERSRINNAVRAALVAADDKATARLLQERELDDVRKALRVLARRPDHGSMVIIGGIVQVLLNRMRQREEYSILRPIMTNTPRGLRSETTASLFDNSHPHRQEWFTIKALAETARIGRQSVDRFVRHYYRMGLLDRRGAKNRGHEYRWVVLPADRQR
jgi:hypothetical protein